jgi:hypothetical protein
MDGMRIRRAALALAAVLLGGHLTSTRLGLARADADPAPPASGEAAQAAPTDPPARDKASLDDSHRFSPALQGALGATAAVLLIAGGALVGSTEIDYRNADVGSNGVSCRPCSNSALASMQGRDYAGYAAMGLGGVLAVVDLVLVVMDAKQRTHPNRIDKTAALRLDGGFRF